MIVRCPRCGMAYPAHYRTGASPKTLACVACGELFGFFPSLEIECAGQPRHPGQDAPKAQPPATAPLRTSPSGRPAPSPIPDTDAHARVRTAGWMARSAGLVTGLGLILALFGQFLVHERPSLKVHPELMALGDALCRHVPCPERMSRNPGTIRIDLLEFGAKDDGHLLVDLEVHNTLGQAQPWPLLQLALSDRHGRVLGHGRWPPGEYLAGTGDARGSLPWLWPEERRRLRLELVPPPRPVEGVMVWPL